MGEELTIIRKPVPTNSPTMRDLMAVIFRQKRLFTLSFIATFLAVLGYGVFAPSYQAHMSVLVRRGRVDPLVTPAPTPCDIQENRELVDGSGFAFRHGNQNDLERMLRLLISEPEIRTAAAGKARERVRDHYLWGRVAREIEDSYLTLAGANPVSTPVVPTRAASYRHRAA
jgi:hypothetical protein